MNILTCEGVCKTYGSGNNQVAALDGIDLAVGKGEFVRLLERPVQVNLHCCIFWEAWINLQAEKLQ